jgi:hypothetical protein
VNIQDAIDVIESVAGFTDESTPVGDAWAEVLSYVYRPRRPGSALAQPEPVAPTDEELLAMRSWSCHGPTFDSDLVDFGHRCYNLGRYGTPVNTINQED